MNKPDDLDTVPEPSPVDRLERPPAWEFRAARAQRAPRPVGAYFLATELECLAAGVWEARAAAGRGDRRDGDSGPD